MNQEDIKRKAKAILELIIELSEKGVSNAEIGKPIRLSTGQVSEFKNVISGILEEDFRTEEQLIDIVKDRCNGNVRQKIFKEFDSMIVNLEFLKSQEKKKKEIEEKYRGFELWKNYKYDFLKKVEQNPLGLDGFYFLYRKYKEYKDNYEKIPLLIKKNNTSNMVEVYLRLNRISHSDKKEQGMLFSGIAYKLDAGCLVLDLVNSDEYESPDSNVDYRPELVTYKENYSTMKIILYTHYEFKLDNIYPLGSYSIFHLNPILYPATGAIATGSHRTNSGRICIEKIESNVDARYFEKRSLSYMIDNRLSNYNHRYYDWLNNKKLQTGAIHRY